MKKNLSQIVSVLACVLLVVCLFQISSLKNEMENLKNNMGNRLSNIEHSVNNIPVSIGSEIERQNSLLASSDWTFGAAKIDARTVAIQCVVVPKEYNPDTTTAALICNGREYPMRLQNGAFSAEIPVSLFEESRVSAVQFEEGGALRTEKLDWYFSPRYDCLPIVYARFSGDSVGRRKDSSFTQRYDGQIGVEVEWRGETVNIQSITLVECMDGKELSRTDVPLNNTPFVIGNAHPERRMDNPSQFYYPLKKDVPIPFGSSYEMYVDDPGADDPFLSGTGG